MTYCQVFFPKRNPFKKKENSVFIINNWEMQAQKHKVTECLMSISLARGIIWNLPPPLCLNPVLQALRKLLCK